MNTKHTPTPWQFKQKASMLRVITIYQRDSNDFDVHIGEDAATRLCWDEMLGAVAAATIPSRLAGSGMFSRTPDELVARMAARRPAT